MIKAIFFDIDGTLVSFKTHKVPETVVQAIDQIRRLGIKVFINTGRMYAQTTNVQHIEFDGYVCYNGACLLDGKGNVIYSDPIPKDELLKLQKYEESNPFPLVFLQENEMTANTRHEDIDWLAGHINVPIPRVDSYERIFETPVYQFCAFLPEDRMKYVTENVMTDCVATQWTPQFFDVNMSHITKGDGMERMLKIFGYDLSQAMAFGDGGNDISMIRAAGVGVAMGNATIETKAAANYITSSVDNDGVIQALSHYGLL